MKTNYQKPAIEVDYIETEQLLVLSDPELGFGYDDAPSLGDDIVDGGLSRDDDSLWDD